jgi:uncharacterized repeat protein (TIGR01451 family)
MHNLFIRQNITKGLHLFFIAALVAGLALGMGHVPSASADGTTSTSDLAIKLIHAPKRAKACQVVKATFKITNLGPDPATGVYFQTAIPDQFGDIALIGAPDTLAVGQTVKVTAVLKVVAFVPGESRSAWIGAFVASDPYPNISIDPNPANNEVSQPVRMVGDPVERCP